MKNTIKKYSKQIAFWVVLLMLSASFGQAQIQLNGPVPAQAAQSVYYVIPISSTGAVNTAITLTIPTPPAGYYNYICKLAFNVSNDTTGTVVTNAVSTSTNFNSVAFKVSQVATASANYDSGTYDWGTPATGCAKSVSPGTATTFVSPTGQTHAMWTWYAMYYQGP